MRKLLQIAPILLFTITLLLTNCSSVQKSNNLEEENRKFLQKDKKASETFRVLLTSSGYISSQMKYSKYIKREKDPSGDLYISQELKKLDKIDEVREGIVKIWLFPDSGAITKVRPIKPTFIIDIDKIITEDIQRWSFKFPKGIVEPTQMQIKYRVVLQKKQSDDEILKEVQQKMSESN